jgi:RND family efflux transporter MFP subunit
MLKYLGIAILAASVLLAGCGKGGEQAEAVRGEKVINVEVFTAEPTVFVEYLTLPIIVNPWREASIGLVQGGRVDRIHVDKGSRVREGQVLLETDTATLQANLKIAEANLAYQKSEFARNQKLFDSGSITEAVFDAARLQLAQAQSAYEIAKKQVEDATLEAPFGGIITDRLVEVGNILGPGTPAFRLIDIGRVKVQAGIPERFVGDFRVGNSVTIMFDAIPEQSFVGRINYLAPEANTSTRTFQAEIAVDNPNGLIRAGIMGNARIQQRIHENALMVPLDALIETQAGRKLFVVLQDSLASERTVSTGSASTDMIMITSGLGNGERVVTKGQHNLVDGERVKITGEYNAGYAREDSTR